MNSSPPAPPTKTFGLNSLVSVTLRTGVRVWVALIKLIRRELRGPGFGGWLRVWVALIKLEGNWGVPGFGGLGRRVWDCLVGFGA